jgi:hypothetical protein
MSTMIALEVDEGLRVAIIVVAIIGILLICIWRFILYTGWQYVRNEKSATPHGPVNVGLVNRRSGEQKYVKVGFSWVLLFFSGLLGIPLFLRCLYVWGAIFLVLCILYVFTPQMLPDTVHAVGAYLLLSWAFLTLQIWVGMKGNEMTAKNLLENGWSFSNPNAQETRFAMTKWNLSQSWASENTPSAVSLPKSHISMRLASSAKTDSVSQSRPVEQQLSTESIPRIREAKFDIYLRLCRAAGILAVSRPDSEEYEIAHRDLITICAGEFQFVASPEVSAALTEFLGHLQARNADHLGALKSEAQKLALACWRDTGAEFHLTSEEQQKMSEELSRGFGELPNTATPVASTGADVKMSI